MAHLLDHCGILRRPTAISTQQAAHFGTQTPAAYNNVALGLIYNGVSSRSLRHPFADRPRFPRSRRCISARRRPRPIHSGACSSGREVHFLYRCGTLRPTDRDLHAAGGASFRHADARGLFTAWRSSYYNGVSSRSLRRLRPTDRDFHSAGGAFRHADARGGFRPANAARTPPHFFPTCDVQEANLFI